MAMITILNKTDQTRYPFFLIHRLVTNIIVFDAVVVIQTVPRRQRPDPLYLRLQNWPMAGTPPALAPPCHRFPRL